MAKTQSAGLGTGSRPYGLGAPAMQAAPPGYGGTPSPPMGVQPGGALGAPQQGAPGAPGVTPPGVPPQLANIWHLLPSHVQQMFGGQSPVSGLLGGQQQQQGVGSLSQQAIFGLLGQPPPWQHSDATHSGGFHPFLRAQLQPQQQQPMQASGNPNPVPQSYQTPSTPLAGATFGGPGQGASGNPYPVPQGY